MSTHATTALRVAAFVRQHRLLDQAPPVLVGFSGGPDSTALLLLLRPLAPRLTAVHLHHGLRGAAADADQAWCRRFCARRGIPFETAALAVPAQRRRGESVEMAARRCRLEFWRRRLATTPAAVVALGHHRDDLAETFLLRLGRGANASGLTGLRPRAHVAGVTFIRPLLDLSRRELAAWLKAHGVRGCRRDATNAADGCPRNRLRHDLLPRLERHLGRAGLHQSLDHLRLDAEYLEAAANRVSVRRLTLAALRRLHPALRPRVLRRWLERATGTGGRSFTEPALRRLTAFLARPPTAPRRLDLDRDWFLRLANGRLSLEPKHLARLPAPRHWHWAAQPRLVLPELAVTLTARTVRRPPRLGPAPGREYFQPAALGDTLVVRQRQPGDRLVPFGSRATIRLKKLLGGARLDPRRRHQLVVLCAANGHLLWVPGVRRAEAGRVTAADATVVELRVRFGGGPGAGDHGPAWSPARTRGPGR